MKSITSTSNQLVKDWKKLSTKKGRQKQQKYLIEGWHLVQEAYLAQAKILQIIVTDDFLWPEALDLTGIDLIQITAQIAKSLSQTPSPQGIFAVVALQNTQISPAQACGAWIFLDGLQDPGNIGTIVRTADAAGFTGVVFGENTADIYQPKVLRAMQGSQFHLTLLKGDLLAWTKSFKEQGKSVYGTQLDDQAKSYLEVDSSTEFALIMGNEGNGMSAALLEETSLNLYIPMQGKAESLNVAVAAGILMFALKK